jgi:hypothetical protein
MAKRHALQAIELDKKLPEAHDSPGFAVVGISGRLSRAFSASSSRSLFTSATYIVPKRFFHL